MALSELIGPHLPYLRRFARCLSGSQESGDAHVVAALQALLADPQILSGNAETRVGLYRVLLAVWKSDPVGSAGTAATRNLAGLTPKSRQAFLLTSVEGFSIKQVAEILLTDVGNVSRLIDQAGREIAEQLATDILIIEDEPLITMDLANLVQSLGHRVSGTARTRDEAVAAAQANRPGLVLADIKLADDSSGIDAVHDILSSINVPVVFITAFPERLLTGERPEPSFLITKPYHEETVKAVVSQALFFDMRAHERADKAARA
jgi:DNA-directed RNA polymerase specialized sigma24 family protein